MMDAHSLMMSALSTMSRLTHRNALLTPPIDRSRDGARAKCLLSCPRPRLLGMRQCCSRLPPRLLLGSSWTYPLLSSRSTVVEKR